VTASAKNVALPIEIDAQPSDTSCGPTCLAAVYRYWNRPVELKQLIADIGQLDGGGTLAVDLACDALRRGFAATIVTYNLQLFDPTWFDGDGEVVCDTTLGRKLRAQRSVKSLRDDVDQHRLSIATDAYLEFLSLGGRLCMRPLDQSLIVASLSKGVPILCGLSATYLYQESRERVTITNQVAMSSEDDVGGEPQGHFVVLHGCSKTGRTVRVADPLHPNPMAPTGKYEAEFSRVASAILLGIVTYDANLLTVQPR
jgi:hypothetical protein